VAKSSTSFEEGNPGGPGAPIKEHRLSYHLAKKLAEIRKSGDYETTTARVENLAELLLSTAETTEDESLRLAYIKEIRDTTEGKPLQKSEVTGKDGVPLIAGRVVFNLDEPQDNGTESE